MLKRRKQESGPVAWSHGEGRTWDVTAEGPSQLCVLSSVLLSAWRNICSQWLSGSQSLIICVCPLCVSQSSHLCPKDTDKTMAGNRRGVVLLCTSRWRIHTPPWILDLSLRMEADPVWMHYTAPLQHPACFSSPIFLTAQILFILHPSPQLPTGCLSCSYPSDNYWKGRKTALQLSAGSWH